MWYCAAWSSDWASHAFLQIECLALALDLLSLRQAAARQSPACAQARAYSGACCWHSLSNILQVLLLIRHKFYQTERC
jgi:hypothetical protein